MEDVVPAPLAGEHHSIGGLFAQGPEVLDGDGQEELWSGTAGGGMVRHTRRMMRAPKPWRPPT